MFVRTKQINGVDYAYFVKNSWRKRPLSGKKGSRQKVSKYLGKVYGFEGSSNDFFDVFGVDSVDEYVAGRGKTGVVKDLVKFELMNRGFKEDGKFMDNCVLRFDMNGFVFFRGDVSVKAVLEMNEGFLCKETINKVLNFKAEGSEEREGYNLAKVFLEAGLKVPEEVFVGYYRRFYGG